MDTNIESNVGTGAGPRESGSIIVQPGYRPGFSWGAVFAGTLVSIGVWLLLHVLTLGIGLTSIDPESPGSLRGAGLGTGIGALIVPLISLFVGGAVASRIAAGKLTRTGAIIHGAVLWALTTILSLWILMSAASALLGGVGRLAGQAAGPAGQAMSSMMPGGAGGVGMQALGVDEQEVLAPTNRRLAAEGKPPVTIDQLAPALQAGMRSAMSGDRVDRQAMVDAMVQSTPMTRQEAQDVAAMMAPRMEQRGSQMRTTAGDVAQGALQGAEQTGKAMLALFFAMLLSLAAAIAGALLFSARRYKGAERRQGVDRRSSPGPTVFRGSAA
jgi:hypothetical protein